MLVDVLGIGAGDSVAVVGAGGKTSLCWLLVQDLAQRGARVIFTTTTRIRQPAPGAFDLQVIGALRAPVTSGWHTACIASAIDGAADDTPVAGSLMPVVHTKLAGFSGEQICNLRAPISNLHAKRPISIIVEADGARGLLIKAPAEYEPVIPPCADVVCVAANLESLGQPLDERVAHRAERIAQLTGAQIGQPITPQLLVDLLAHPDGGLKGIPSMARKVAVLMQRAEMEPHPEAAFIVRELVSRRFDQAMALSPRARDVYPLIFASARK